MGSISRLVLEGCAADDEVVGNVPLAHPRRPYFFRDARRFRDRSRPWTRSPTESAAVYTVTRSYLQTDDTVIYYAHAGDEAIARAVVRVFGGCIDDVLVYKESNRRRGIASALYKLIEDELGRSLKTSRIRSREGRAFWRVGAEVN